MDRHRPHKPLPVLPARDTRTLAHGLPSPTERLPSRSSPPHPGRTPSMSNQHNTAQYRAWRKQVLAKCEPTCIRCGYPVDMTLPGSHPDGPSADHEPPLAETGEIAPSLDQAGIAHLSCNRSHGGKIGAARSAASRKGTTANRPQPDRIRGRQATCRVCSKPFTPGDKAKGYYCSAECFGASRRKDSWQITYVYNCAICQSEQTHVSQTHEDPDLHQPSLKRTTCGNLECIRAHSAILGRDKYRSIAVQPRASKYGELKDTNLKWSAEKIHEAIEVSEPVVSLTSDSRSHCQLLS